ncbi:MAG: hypothetical protein KME12_26825 [Trichocoleus desertorum ATA4-8-CV12]|jgi:hypothetical protein|nr:hypothetical protein [Trichocoleus desertorum ATA4-8-CV12]
MKITLTEEEKRYCLESGFLPTNYTSIISSATYEDTSYVVSISEEDADEIRDLFSEQLQIVGFDESYSPTVEGRMLETLIDKFFIN